MTKEEVLQIINTFIVENNNNEITADILRPILENILLQPNELIGILANLATEDQTSIVAAINELAEESGDGIVIHYGTQPPALTPPETFSVTDYYIQQISGTLIGLWQYNGLEWVEQKAYVDKNSFYDTYHSLDGNTLEDVIPSMSEKFYILEIFDTEKFYFASKETNIESFENSRIYLSGNGEKYDLGEPTSTSGGYNFWDLGEIANNPTSVEPQAFQFWIRKGGSTDFNGDRTVTRSDIPNINVGGETVAEFLNNYFFPAVQPIVGLTNISQSIEKGSNIEDMAVNISFTQNDAGAATGYSLEKNGTEISTTQNNSIDETNITAQIQYQGFVTYAEGTGIEAGTKASPIRTITPRLKMWYAAVSAIPDTSAEVRALANDVWDNQDEITLNTGTTETNFVVAVPSSKTTAASLSAQDITNNIALTYDFQNTVTVNLPTGTQEYIIYALSVDNAYPANAQHKISI